MLPYTSRRDAPAGWCLVLEHLLHASPQLTKRLWLLFAPRCPLGLRYQLEHCWEYGIGATPAAVMRTVTPRLLLDLTVQASPEGQPRDPEIVAFEQAILDHMR